MPRKCTHPKGFDRNGQCPICRKRKPGRPRTRTKPRPPEPRRPITAPATTPPPPTTSTVAINTPQEPERQTDLGRAARLARLGTSTAPPPVDTSATPSDLDEIEPDDEIDDESNNEVQSDTDEPPTSSTTTIGYGWDWTANKLTTALDLVSDIAIDRLTDRDPLEAGEDEKEELQRVAAEYGSKRLGHIEAPTWLVFVIAVTFFVLSKYVGAPRKPTPIPTTPGKIPPTPADTAGTKTPAAAPVAATHETPRPIQAPTVEIGGNAEGAGPGF